MTASDRLVVALDTPDADRAEAWARELSGEAGWFKVGLELFAAAGPAVVPRIARHGRVFLDLKLHDIPNTVAGAVRAVANLGAGLLTVHASGGEAMLRAAAEAAPAGLRIVGVTRLTSLDAEPSVVLSLARLCRECGLAGVVSAATEVEALRAALGKECLCVTPGIRPADAAVGDQARVATPAAALRAGADLLVVGRPITAAPDRLGAARSIVAEMGAEMGAELHSDTKR